MQIMDQLQLFKGIRVNPTDEILDFDYEYSSHTFNRAVITAYNNLFKYPFKITKDYIQVFQSKRDTIFVLNPEYNLKQIVCKKKPLFLCETEIEGVTKKKVKEEYYDLRELFLNPNKQIRRGMKERDNITFVEPISFISNEIYFDWEKHKINDPKVYRIAFNPRRYWRCSFLKEAGFNIYEKLVLVNEQPYGVIIFSLQGDKAYELSFISRYFDKGLRIINDLNEIIIIRCFYDLWKNYQIKTVNVGVNIGNKGLSFFKKQFKGQELIIYSS